MQCLVQENGDHTEEKKTNVLIGLAILLNNNKKNKNRKREKKLSPFFIFYL